MKLIGAVAIAVILGATCALAQFEVGIVLPFENNTRDPNLEWISEGFVEVLSDNLSSSRLMMLDRRERAAAFDRLGIPATSILSTASIYKLGEALDANKLVLGSYELSDGVFKATARVLEMDYSRLSGEFTESGPLESLMDLQLRLAWQIQSHLRPAYPISLEDYLKERRGPRLDAFENYLRGLIARDRPEQVSYYRTAARLDPQFSSPSFQLGMIYFHDRDYGTSVLWLAKLRRGDPDYLEAGYFLGLAYFYLEQYERSATAFRVVAQELPLNEVFNNLGIALARLDRPGAISYFERAVASNPTDPDYQFNLGYAYWKRGSCEEALPHLKIAMPGVRSAPHRFVYWQCLEKTGRQEESAQQAQLLEQQGDSSNLKRDPKLLEMLERPKNNYDGTSFRQLRVMFQLQSEMKHARLSLEDHVAAHVEKGRQLAAESLDREAIEELQQAVDYDPSFAEGYLVMARIHQKAGRTDEAIKSAGKANGQEKTTEGLLLLARLYLDQGKLQEAQEQLDAALRLEPASAEAGQLMEEMNPRDAETQRRR